MTQFVNWTTEFFAWADENHISAEKLPRDEETLLSQTALNLSFCKLTQLPESLANLTHLTELDLAYNALTELPEWIDNFTALEKLDVSGNSITSLPDSLRHLPNLVVLGLDKQIRKENKKMEKKRYWMDELFEWAEKNNISENKLLRTKSSRLLFSKEFLDLSCCELTHLPDAIGEFGNSKNLRTLNLSNNLLGKIPDSLGKLKSLTFLYLHQNLLKKCPDFFCNLKNLEGLVLNNNQLTEITEHIGNLTNLTHLDIANNQLTALPESIGNLVNLRLLDLTNNPIVKLPISISNIKDLKIIGFSNNSLQITSKIDNMKTYQQKILFGSPGTGKSHKIDKEIIPDVLEITDSANIIKTVFHPEYTYGDFVGKLMPITVGGNVQYKFYEGHFLKALSQAYKNIIASQDNDEEIENVALVIDEINRGNSAAIFGTIFQLLDRESDGWSSYEVSVNEIIFNRLFELCDLKIHSHVTGTEKVSAYKLGEETIFASDLQNRLDFLGCHFENRTIKIPPNLSILASMNTSDSSIYYMDSAFKRRWEWEFIDVDSNTVSAEGVAFETRDEWIEFVSKLNAFIKSNHKSIRGIEDKQIGHFFISDEQILKSSIQNKLMFFLWDSVFNRDKKPLIDLLFGKDVKHDESPLITFGDFATLVDLFIEKFHDSADLSTSFFEQVVALYNQSALPELQTRGNSNGFKYISFNNWQKGIHYEFLKYASNIGVELHLENSKFSFLSDILKEFQNREIQGIKLEWDKEWRKLGRLKLVFSNDTSPSVVVDAMHELIKLTAPELKNLL